MGIVPGKDLDPAFLRLYFMSVDLRTIADGSSVPQINYKGVASLTIPLMGLEQQRSVVARAKEIEVVVSRFRASPLLIRGNALRRSLLQAAFSGQLTKESVSV